MNHPPQFSAAQLETIGASHLQPNLARATYGPRERHAAVPQQPAHEHRVAYEEIAPVSHEYVVAKEPNPQVASYERPAPQQTVRQRPQDHRPVAQAENRRKRRGGGGALFGLFKSRRNDHYARPQRPRGGNGQGGYYVEPLNGIDSAPEFDIVQATPASSRANEVAAYEEAMVSSAAPHADGNGAAPCPKCGKFHEPLTTVAAPPVPESALPADLAAIDSDPTFHRGSFSPGPLPSRPIFSKRAPKSEYEVSEWGDMPGTVTLEEDEGPQFPGQTIQPASFESEWPQGESTPALLQHENVVPIESVTHPGSIAPPAGSRWQQPVRIDRRRSRR